MFFFETPKLVQMLKYEKKIRVHLKSTLNWHQFKSKPTFFSQFPERICWFEVQKLTWGKKLLFLMWSWQKVVIHHRLWTKQQKIIFKWLSETGFKLDLPFLVAWLCCFLLSQLAGNTLYYSNNGCQGITKFYRL